MVIRLAHDFVCPWCWIGLHQVRRMQAELGVSFEWVGHELYPENPPGPPKPRVLVPADRPRTPTRIELGYAAQGIPVPPFDMDSVFVTRNAHEAVEHAKGEGTHEALIEALYRATWEQGIDVGRMENLERVAQGVVLDLEGMLRAVEERRYAHRIVQFDEPAHAGGVYNVPTFFIGGARYAEQPYRVLVEAVRRAKEAA